MRNSWISSQFLQFYFSWNFFLFFLPSFSSLFDFSPSLSPFDLFLSLLKLSFLVVSVSFLALEFFDRSPFDFCWLPVLKPNCIFTSCAVCLIWNCKQPNKLRIYKSRKECACSMFHIILFVELLSVCAFLCHDFYFSSFPAVTAAVAADALCYCCYSVDKSHWCRWFSFFYLWFPLF